MLTLIIFEIFNQRNCTVMFLCLNLLATVSLIHIHVVLCVAEDFCQHPTFYNNVKKLDKEACN